MAMISQNIEKHGYWQGIQKSCVSPLFTIQDVTPFSREFSERHDGSRQLHLLVRILCLVKVLYLQ